MPEPSGCSNCKTPLIFSTTLHPHLQWTSPLIAGHGSAEMHHATPDQLKEILSFSAPIPRSSHIRQDALQHRIDAGQCVSEDGVVITYQPYQKRTRGGTVDVPVGAVMLHQIVNSNQFNGSAARVFERSCGEAVWPAGGQLSLGGSRDRHCVVSLGKIADFKSDGEVTRRASASPRSPSNRRSGEDTMRNRAAPS